MQEHFPFNGRPYPEAAFIQSGLAEGSEDWQSFRRSHGDANTVIKNEWESGKKTVE